MDENRQYIHVELGARMDLIVTLQCHIKCKCSMPKACRLPDTLVNCSQAVQLHAFGQQSDGWQMIGLQDEAN